MDVMRVDTEDGQRRFCCCVAAYGYMGDLMCESERLRWLGPGRYNLAGAMSLFKNKVCLSGNLCCTTTNLWSARICVLTNRQDALVTASCTSEMLWYLLVRCHNSLCLVHSVHFSRH